MTHPKALEQPRGGSTLVKESGSVEKSAGPVNPGDPRYAELLAKAPVDDERMPGTLNRVPSHADLEEHPKPPAPRERAATTAQTPQAATTKGDK